MSGEAALSVRGGAGGAAVNLSELGALAALLRDVAHLLHETRAALTGAAAGLEPALALGLAAAEQAATVLGRAHLLAVRCETEAASLAERARSARDGYEEAESGVLARLAGVFVPAGPGALLARSAGSWPFLGLEGHQTLRALGWAMAVTPGSMPVAEVTVVGEMHQSIAPMTGVTSLLTDIESLYPAAGGETGTMEVRRVEQPGGGRSWVVLIPGTQSLAAGGANPLDNATNLQEFVGAPSAMSTAVLAALSAAGAGRREPVLLAGHSQGGIVATRLAADPEVRQRFRVTSVLTAGSPVGHIPVPAGVSTLHLEHSRDIVPTLDDAANPDEADRVTVRHDGGSGSVGSAHAVSSYARTGELVDASAHPSLQAWRERAAEVLGDDTARTTRTVYSVRRS